MARQITQLSNEEHAKRQKAAAEQTEKALAAETIPEESTHPLVDSQLTDCGHTGKIPGEPDKERDIRDVNLEILPPQNTGGVVTTVRDPKKASAEDREALEKRRENQEKGVQNAIEKAKERTEEIKAEAEEAAEHPAEATEEAMEAERKAKATGKKSPTRKRYGKK